jgi:hypothetical protein
MKTFRTPLKKRFRNITKKSGYVIFRPKLTVAIIPTNIAEPQISYADPAPGKYFEAARALARLRPYYKACKNSKSKKSPTEWVKYFL